MRILYATDGSEGARIALDFVLALRPRRADEVRVLAVPIVRTLALAFDGGAPLGTVVESAFDAATELAERARDRVRASGARAEAVVRAGEPPTTTILDEAERSASELIVVGSRGFGVLRGILLGSTSRWLAQHSPIPVLVVRDRRVAPSRVLVAAAGREDERRAIETLERLPLPEHLGLTPLRTAPGAPAAGQILGLADAVGADLIVLGPALVRSGGELLATGVAADVLARARCSVLLSLPVGAAIASSVAG